MIYLALTAPSFILYHITGSENFTVDLVGLRELDSKTVSSFAGRSKTQARSSNGKLGRRNGRADGSEKEWGEGLKKETVAIAYFKSVLEFSDFRSPGEGRDCFSVYQGVYSNMNMTWGLGPDVFTDTQKNKYLLKSHPKK